MSATGIVPSGELAGRRHDAKALATGSRAAHRPLSLRTQSPKFRDAPWAARLKPLTPWNEIGTYAFAAVVTAGALTFALI